MKREDFVVGKKYVRDNGALGVVLECAYTDESLTVLKYGGYSFVVN